MNYNQTENWILNRLPFYQSQGSKAYKPGLDNIKSFVDHLNINTQDIKLIHVGGTNGKGSTCAYLSSIIQESGYRVGTFTSPHFFDYRERIKVNNNKIEKDFISQFIINNRDIIEKLELTFFELSFGMSLSYYIEKNVDYAIIEVGLGGRLDATNIIMPEGCLITNISLDHQQFLGTTRAEIAREKAGIIKSKIPVVVVENDAETFPVFKTIAQEKNASLHLASQRQFTTDLLGDYQKQNINGVVSLLHVLPQFSVSELHIIDGLQRVVKNTGLRGRWEILENQPKIIADVAHNPAGLQAVFAQLKKEQSDKLHIIFGVVSDKKVSEITTFLPKKAHYYLCTANVPRAMNTSELAFEFIKNDFSFSTHDSVQQAFEAAKTAASKNDLIFVGGSLFVVAEILA